MIVTLVMWIVAMMKGTGAGIVVPLVVPLLRHLLSRPPRIVFERKVLTTRNVLLKKQPPKKQPGKKRTFTCVRKQATKATAAQKRQIAALSSKAKPTARQ